MAFTIFLSPPNTCGKEREFVKEAFDTNWIAPYGPHIRQFENEMSDYIGMEAALALTSGTAAIHLALKWFGVGQGDLVFCSDFTFIGTCNPIMYQSAEPVFIDCEPNTWNMSPIALEKAFEWARSIGRMPKAVIIVDMYGESANWDQLLPICRHNNVPVIEDAAEAVGTIYKGKKCGSFGEMGILSFNGNKIITTSGGGMALSNDTEAIGAMRQWSTQSREPMIWYEHNEVGYNYRLSNVSAAIGLGQMCALEYKLNRRKEIRNRYAEAFSDLPVTIKQSDVPGASNYWLSMMYINDKQINPIKVVTTLQNSGIESRPAWKPMHLQPVFKKTISFSHNDKQFEGAKIFEKCVCLPSGDGMTEDQQEQVILEIKKLFI